MSTTSAPWIASGFTANRKAARSPIARRSARSRNTACDKRYIARMVATRHPSPKSLAWAAPVPARAKTSATR